MGILALTVIVATAAAQSFRQLPANGKLGELTGQRPFPLLQIDDNTVRLAPGGRIYDENNRIILHSSLPSSGTVLFVRDTNGDVSRVYILRADEIDLIRQRQQP